MEIPVSTQKLKKKEKLQATMMKQCSSTTTTSSSAAAAADFNFNDDEILVAQILLDLPNLIPRRTMTSWGVRKKRSVPLPRDVEAEEAGRPKVKVESTSPSTPLCFYPSESDDKSKINLKKRTREELVEMIDGLTRTRESMRREVENERNRYKKLKALNLSFKEKKKQQQQQQQQGVERVKQSKESRVDLKPKFGPPQIQSQSQNQNQNQMMMMMMVNHSRIYESQASGRFNYDHHHHPRGLPDLNVGLEVEEGTGMMDCFQPSDRVAFMDERLICATQARRRRMIKIKAKEIKRRHHQPRVR